MARFEAGETVVIWGGVSVASATDAEKASRLGKIVMRLDDDLYTVEDRGQDDTYFMNHSCDPNVWMANAWTLIARRAIAVDEELTLDYALVEADETFASDWVCGCRSADCRTRVTGKDWLLPELQRRYKDHFSPLLIKRIVRLREGDGSGTLTRLAVEVLADHHVQLMTRAFSACGLNKASSVFEGYVAEQPLGKRLGLVALVNGELAGFVTVLWRSEYGPFRAKGIPEIQDLNVLPHLRRRGIATRLMTETEARVEEVSPIVGLAVGMDQDYGPAQRMYALRGYVLDGLGLTYAGRHLRWGDKVDVDDSLVLYMTKQLRSGT